jgi:hypothetical protein
MIADFLELLAARSVAELVEVKLEIADPARAAVSPLTTICAALIKT